MLRDWRIIHLDVVDSTNDEARRRALAEQGSDDRPRPIWLVANRQLHGKGRQGRKWTSFPGGMNATLSLLRPHLDLSHVCALPFLSSLALVDCLLKFAPNTDFGLKWPNDICYDGRKLAGILIESSRSGEEIEWLGIGMGVNLCSPSHAGSDSDDPDDDRLDRLHIAPAFLRELTGRVIPPEEFIRELAPLFSLRWQQMMQKGTEIILSDWLQKALWLGKSITVQSGTDKIVGIFETIDKNGALLLRTKNGLKTFRAGQVSLRQA